MSAGAGPRTEAGRRFYAHFKGFTPNLMQADDIIAIEDEVRHGRIDVSDHASCQDTECGAAWLIGREDQWRRRVIEAEAALGCDREPGHIGEHKSDPARSEPLDEECGHESTRRHHKRYGCGGMGMTGRLICAIQRHHVAAVAEEVWDPTWRKWLPIADNVRVPVCWRCGKTLGYWTIRVRGCRTRPIP